MHDGNTISPVAGQGGGANQAEGFERIINASKSPMTLISRDFRYEVANHAYCRAHNMDPQDVIDKTVTDIWGGSIFETYIQPHLEKCFSGQATNRYGWFRFHGQQRRCYDVNYYPCFDPHNDVTHAAVVTHDVTRYVRMQSDQQDVSMEAIATLAGGIAHQFNNALTGITGSLDLIEMDQSVDSHVARYVTHMRSSVDRMTELTSQLLGYAGRGKYHEQVLALGGILQEVVADVRQSVSPVKRIVTDLPGGIHRIKADPEQIRTVIAALITNAAEAIEDEGRILVKCTNVKIKTAVSGTLPYRRPGSYVALTVEDDGRGMEPALQRRVFEPFFTTKFMGRGLGLAAVYGIVKSHGGWVTVTSNVDEGTQVKVMLPAVAPSVVDQDTADGGQADLRGTILVIEDEPLVMNISKGMLQKLGYRALEARNGQEAIEIATGFGGPIEMALLDMVLPDMGGKNLFQQLVVARPDMKVVVCSGYPSDGPAKELMDEGAVGFIQKPLTITHLTEQLAKVFPENGASDNP